MKKPTRTILIVENDVSVQATTAHHLVNVGYNLHTSVNGAGMFLALWKEYPDLILLNPNLPDGDGLDYANKFSSKPTYRLSSPPPAKTAKTALRSWVSVSPIA